MKQSRKLATLPKSNFQWTRDANYNWVCLIENCSKCFRRKSHLVSHRGQVHKLSVYERGIPDQRREKKGKKGENPAQVVFLLFVGSSSTDSLWTHMFSCYTDVVEEFQSAVDKRERPGSIRKGDLVKRLMLDGPNYIKRGSDFDKLSIDQILHMLFYGIQNMYFEYSSSMGFELVGQLVDRLHEKIGLNEKLREARKLQRDAVYGKCGARSLVNSIQFNVL